MSKVTSLDAKRKSCPHCGKRPPCPDFTCKRIASVFESEDGVEVTYVADFEFPPEEPNPAA